MNDDPFQTLLNSLQASHDRFSATLDSLDVYNKCERHGSITKLNRDASFTKMAPQYECPECEKEAKTRRRMKRIARAGIPADVRHASLGNFSTKRPGVRTDGGFSSPEKFLQLAREFDRGDKRNMILCGSVGVGKSHLAAALAISALDRGRTAAWIECARLFSDYHSRYNNGSGWEVIDYFASADVFVLDEVCFKPLPADGEEILYDIFSRRRVAGRQSILVGNQSREATLKWLGSRISDRLRTGGCSFAFGQWDSMRGGAGDSTALKENEF